MNATGCVLALFGPGGGTERSARALGQGTGLPAPMKLAVGTFLKASAGRPKRPALFL